MPTPHKSTANMKKHLTKGERRAREAAENQLQRGKRVLVRAPSWLSDEAKKIFHRTKRQLQGLDLLDNVDAELLAIYSDAVVSYQTTFDVKDKQAWSRLVLSYAEKLGISASARVRLAKKAAEHIPPDELEELLNDVTEYVNRGAV